MTSKIIKGRRLIRDEDALEAFIIVLALIISAISALVLPLFTDMDYDGSLLILSVPFLVAGILEVLIEGRWSFLLAAIILCGISFLVGWQAFLVIAMLTFGSFGIAGTADILQRAFTIKGLDIVESIGSKDRIFGTRIMSRFLNINQGTDCREVSVDGTPTKELFPRTLMERTFIPALAVMMIAWIGIIVGFEGELINGCLIAFTTALYVAAVTTPVSILDSIDARVSGISLFSGYIDTARVILITLFLVVVAVALLITPSLDQIIMMATSGFFCTVIIAFSLLIHRLGKENRTISDISAEWKSTHISIYSSLEASNGRFDDVPGTPKLPEDYCFQKN